MAKFGPFIFWTWQPCLCLYVREKGGGGWGGIYNKRTHKNTPISGEFRIWTENFSEFDSGYRIRSRIWGLNLTIEFSPNIDSNLIPIKMRMSSLTKCGSFWTNVSLNVGQKGTFFSNLKVEYGRVSRFWDSISNLKFQTKSKKRNSNEFARA